MTMLEVLKSRLPEGLTICSVKERQSKYKIVFEYEGTQAAAELDKTSAPGKHNKVADLTIITAMSAILYAKGDIDGAKAWMDKLHDVSQEADAKETPSGCAFCDNYDFTRVGFDFDAGRDMPTIYFPGNPPVPPADQRFKFCPVCGKPLTDWHFLPPAERRERK